MQLIKKNQSEKESTVAIARCRNTIRKYIQIKKKYQNIGFAVEAFKKLEKLHKKKIYKATISHKNIQSQKFCESLGFKFKYSSEDRIGYEKIYEK